MEKGMEISTMKEITTELHQDFCCGQFEKGFMTRVQFFNLLEQCSYCIFPAGFVGILGNILIIVTYFNIGLSSSINISYVALAFSDFFCVLSNMWMALCSLPVFKRFAGQYFFPGAISSLTGAWVCECFTRITAYMTAFISMERCLSVMMPLKVSSIFTRGRTSAAVIVIYGLNIALASYGFVIIRFVKKFSPFYNKTIVTTNYAWSPLLEDVYNFVLIFQSFPALMIPLVTVIVCTAFLSLSLRRSAAWRRSMVSTDQTSDERDKSLDKLPAARQRNLKEIQLAKTVVLVAVVFIVCSSPNAINVLVASVLPEYRATGRYGILFRFTNFITFALSMVNSSSNFFIYLSTGSIFRRTLKRILCLSSKTDKPFTKQVET
ncbi:chemosensory receptor a [Plakobranchus ocellatus]|uniref:Chemosensory receptor a n=1 Tax=Plakobranchus ocellatus TaxID=259542 RepID=A0AAV3YB26_9GAST|nr:chemosensory receptor a [Plakobranchus ocellatus]